tara:strand:- start:236 stop:877 length:642 start_codon:yes stop_codon:yes gene_type:complete
MGFIGVQPASVPLTADDVPDLPATKITSGTFPALNGSNLTSLTAGNLTGTLPAISGANLTGVSAGKVLQVTQNKIVGERNSNSTSYVATNIHHNITPASSSNKVLVIVSLPSIYSSNRERPTAIKLYRHSAVVSVGGSVAGSEINGDFHMNYQGGSDKQGTKTVYTELDSPSSTSAVYYQIYFRSHNSDNTSYIGQGGGSPVANVTLLEIDGS